MGGHAEKLVFGGICLHQLTCAFLHRLLKRFRIFLQNALLLSYLLAQLVRLNSSAQGSRKVIAVNRFLNKIIRTPAQSLNSEIVITVASYEQRRRSRSQFLYLRQQRQTIHAGHLDIARSEEHTSE